jgi:hypothetical protein
VRDHYGTYHALTDGKARAGDLQQAWHRRDPKLEATRPASDLLALSTRGGELHICTKRNLAPITDSAAFTGPVQGLAMDRSGRGLLLIEEGELRRVNIHRWRKNPVLKRNVRELLGEEVLRRFEWMTTEKVPPAKGSR